ncbi:helix-turn-helix domain-containing protein [Bacillus cereus]
MFFLYKHAHELSESAIKVLKFLARHSCKIPGVSFLKVGTIAEALNISDRTVRRVLKVLEDFEVVTRHKTIRTEGKLRGGNGHNVYVLLKNIVSHRMSYRKCHSDKTKKTLQNQRFSMRNRTRKLNFLNHIL